MYYAMRFVPTEFGISVRAVRAKPYNSFEEARAAVIRKGEGYVKKLGEAKPHWTNVH